MPDDERDDYDVDRSIRQGCMRVLLLLVALIVAIIVCVAIGGCTTVREVTVVPLLILVDETVDVLMKGETLSPRSNTMRYL